MSDNLPTNAYYPALSNLISVEDLPDILGFLKDGLQTVFAKIYYKDLQSSQNITGSSSFYSLSLVSRTKLALELPGTGIYFVLNPDYQDNTVSSFPISVFWNWEILRYVRSFNANGFSFEPEALFNLMLEILNITEAEVLELATNTFVTTDDLNTSQFSQLVNDLNTFFGSNIVIDETSDTRYEELSAQIKLIGNQVYAAIFSLYILSNDINEAKEKVNYFFSTFIPKDVTTFIKELILPKFRATLKLSAAIEFPNSILKPVQSDGTPIENETTKFRFAQALLYVDSRVGIGYQMELAGSLIPQYAAIGNTGLILQIESLKLDLSKKSNIAEADIDGRPNDFVGVYAKAVSIAFPQKWFSDSSVPTGNVSTTLRLGGYDLLVGSGGISGTIMLESIPVITGNTDFEYYNDKFSFNYPITLLEKSTTSDEIIEKIINDYDELKSYLHALNGTSNNPYPFKYPLSLTPVGGGAVLTFGNAVDYQRYLATLNHNVLWKRLGGENGFDIGFNTFDITFKQNVVTESNIKGALKIDKLTPKEGSGPLLIDVEGHLTENGDFNVTASVANGIIEASLFGYVNFNFLSLEVGKSEDKYYIGTSCEISFPNETMNMVIDGSKKIVLPDFRIYSDGSMELVGGNASLPLNVELKLGPVTISATNIQFGSYEDAGGIKYNYFGFDGSLNINPLGIDGRGKGLRYYYPVDPNQGGKSFIHISTIEVDLIIPGDASAATAAVIIHGALSIPEPGKSKEYSGEISLNLPQLKFNAAVAMRLAPRVPAFYVEASVGLPAPIPIGAISLYEFGGLVGYRYILTKAAAKLPETATWYEYFKKSPIGVDYNKVELQDKKDGSTPFSVGAGTVLGTTADLGRTFSARVMMILSLPSVFLLDGRASVLSDRIGMRDTKEPPFFAMFAWGTDAIELGIGAHFKIPDSGSVLTINGDVQARFPKKNAKDWYINAGTKEKPIEALLFKDILNLRSNAYLMISSKGIALGASSGVSLNLNVGGIKVKISAYSFLDGQISFGKFQFGANWGVNGLIDVNVWKLIMVKFTLDTNFTVEAPAPFLIAAEVTVRGKLKFLFVKISFSITLPLRWEKNNSIDISSIDPLPLERKNELVQGVHMLTNDVYPLTWAGGDEIVTLFPDDAKYIPVDTYIDLKTEKGLLPSSLVNNLIGGAIASSENIELYPPVSNIKGQKIRQVKHTYTIENIVIKAYSEKNNRWENYHPYNALLPTASENAATSVKSGYWQITGTRNDYIRLLSDYPFDYLKQLQPNTTPVEEQGLTTSTIINPPSPKNPDSMNVLDKPIGKIYPFAQKSHQINGVYFRIPTYFENPLIKESEIIPFNTLKVTGMQNAHNIEKSLTLSAFNKLQIDLPEDSMTVKLMLSATAKNVSVRFYQAVTVGDLIQDDEENAKAINSSYIQYVEVLKIDLDENTINNEVSYVSASDNKIPISRIVIEADISSYSTAMTILRNGINDLLFNSYLLLAGDTTLIIPKDVKTFAELQSQLNNLNQNSNVYVDNGCEKISVCELFYDLGKNDYPSEINSASEIDYTKVAQFIQKIENSGLKSQLEPYFENYENAQTALSSSVTDTEKLNNYSLLNNAAYKMMEQIYTIGKCNQNTNYENGWLSISVQQIEWLSVSKYEYNITIPATPPVVPSVMTVINERIHPIWRPNTKYLLQFKLFDTVSWGSNSRQNKYYYNFAFKTRGVTGHLIEPEATLDVALKQQLSKIDNLSAYIDFNRSNPNADGDLLMSKPLFGEAAIELFFKESYVSQLLQSWEGNDWFDAKSNNLTILVKDPLGADIANSDISLFWNSDNNIPLNSGQQYLNAFLNANATSNTGLTPFCKTPKFMVSGLKPQKLYTATLFNEYENSKKEIHRFSFLTSRYSNFQQQVESYNLLDSEGNTKKAIFDITVDLDSNYVNKAFSIVSGENPDIDKELSVKYPYSFDCVTEGVFLLKPLESVQNTEFNLIYNLKDGKLIAILIRNPEPLNNPRIPLKEIRDTISVLKDDNTLDKSFSVLYSKDYSQAIIMQAGNDITDDILTIRFAYKQWDESVQKYVEREYHAVNIDLMNDTDKGLEFWEVEESFVVQ